MQTQRNTINPKDMEIFDLNFTTVENRFNDDETDHFETFGKEFDYVKEQKEEHIWTVINHEDSDEAILVAGFLTNKDCGDKIDSIVHYVITEEKWTNTDLETDYIWG